MRLLIVLVALMATAVANSMAVEFSAKKIMTALSFAVKLLGQWRCGEFIPLLVCCNVEQ